MNTIVYEIYLPADLAIFCQKDQRHCWNLPISFRIFALEIKTMFLNLSELKSLWNSTSIFSKKEIRHH